MSSEHIFSIDQARAAQAAYRPNPNTAATLQQTSALLFVGPAGIGKSTTLDLVARLDDRFGRTGSIGSRPLEPRDDPRRFRHVTKDDLLEKIASGDVVQYAIHPTTDSIYATMPDMYSASYNMLEMLPSGVDQFRHLGFGGLQVFYMVTHPQAWRQWFETRYPDHSAERAKRLGEATLSLQWALDQPDGAFIWLQNTLGDQQTTAKNIIHSATTGETMGDYRHLAEEMLELTKKL